ncbi:DUF4124 domain-containing protein [Methylomagnum sp.]
MKCLFVLLAVLAALPVQARTFKCVDASGRTEFRQAAVPPEGCKAIVVNTIPYDETEAARAKDNLRQTEACNRAFDTAKAEQAERLAAQRAAEEHARLQRWVQQTPPGERRRYAWTQPVPIPTPTQRPKQADEASGPSAINLNHSAR